MTTIKATSYKTAKAIPELILAALFLIMAVLQISFTGIYYTRTLANTEQSQSLRIMHAYVTNQARQAAFVETTQFDGAPALSCVEDGGDYTTLIYLHNGVLYELYAGIDSGLTREDGTALIPLESFDIAQEQPNLFKISMTDPDGQSVTVTIMKEAAA